MDHLVVVISTLAHRGERDGVTVLILEVLCKDSCGNQQSRVAVTLYVEDILSASKDIGRKLESLCQERNYAVRFGPNGRGMHEEPQRED